MPVDEGYTEPTPQSRGKIIPTWTNDRPPRDTEGDGVSIAGAAGVARYIYWTLSPARNLAHKSIMLWIKSKSLTTSRAIFGLVAAGASDESFSINEYSNANRISFECRWSGTAGIWQTDSDMPSGLFHLAVTYDNDSSSNVPLIYLNGALQSITQIQPPSGTYVSGTNTTLNIGRTTEQAYSMDGRIMSVLMYNTILSADDISSAYNHGAVGAYVWAEHHTSGLVFCPNLYMVTGIARNSFIGASITSSNKFLNYVDGAQGTVSGTLTGEGAS